MSARTVRELIEQQALTRPHSPYALDPDGGPPLCFGDLAQDLTGFDAWLTLAGAAVGQTVAVVMPNGLGTLRAHLLCMATRRCVVAVNLLAQPEVLRHVLGHSDCQLVLCSPDRLESVRNALAPVERSVEVRVVDPQARRLDGEPVATSCSRAQLPTPLPGDTALLMYTSGTTGMPKGVMLTHAQLTANAHAIAREHQLGAEDRVLGVLPLYHINAFVVTMLTPLSSGGSVVLAPRFSAQRFWAQAHEGACTWLNVVPTMVSYLLEGPDPKPEWRRSYRFCRSASAALPVDHLLAFEQRFGIDIVETMGLTETCAPVFSNPIDPARRRPGAVGLASGCEARVIDPLSLAILPDGETGEITLRGPQVMRGYYKDEAATAATFTPDGWLRTGDLGHRDAEGYFFVTGRIKELIIKGGENIAPREIDEALLRHPAVLDAAAVGIADRHYGQEIMACVVLRDGAQADEASLREFCVTQLGTYKTPSVFRIVPDLPRGPSGKVQRLKLRALAR